MKHASLPRRVLAVLLGVLFVRRSASLEVMKDMQRQRQRSKGVTLLPKGGTDLETGAEEEEEASTQHGLCVCMS